MKKSLRKIISIFAVIAMLATPIYAADTMQLDWSADYETMELVLNITAPAKYIQTASVVMYPTAVASPSFADYARIGEVTLKGQNQAEYRIKLANDLTATNGEYTVKVVGSGNYDEDNGYAANRATQNVKIATPAGIDTLLANINGANANNLVEGDAVITEAKDILQIDVTGEESDAKLQGFVKTRTADYSGAFATLNDVKAAWLVADVIDYMSGSMTRDDLREKYEIVSDMLAVDMADEDYSTYANTIYSNIILLKSEFGAATKSGVENLFKKAKALTVVNATNSDGMGAVIEKYHTDLALDATAYSKYAALTDSAEDQNSRTKIHRAITSKNFTTVAALQKAFKDTALGGGGGGAGGGGGGGTTSGNDKTPSNLGGVEGDIAPFVPAQGGFSDCSASHWAYTYVDALKESGIIGGYPDGKFYPENSVNREEFVKMIVLAADLYSKDADCDFDDVSKDEWFFDYVASASKLQLVNGVGDGSFGIGQKISRQDVAVIVNRILLSRGIEAKDGEAQTFTDSDKASDYAVESIKALTNLGILNGFDDGSFRPQNNLSRAEAAKIISVFKEYIAK